MTRGFYVDLLGHCNKHDVVNLHNNSIKFNLGTELNSELVKFWSTFSIIDNKFHICIEIYSFELGKMIHFNWYKYSQSLLTYNLHLFFPTKLQIYKVVVDRVQHFRHINLLSSIHIYWWNPLKNKKKYNLNHKQESEKIMENYFKKLKQKPVSLITKQNLVEDQLNTDEMYLIWDFSDDFYENYGKFQVIFIHS